MSKSGSPPPAGGSRRWVTPAVVVAAAAAGVALGTDLLDNAANPQTPPRQPRLDVQVVEQPAPAEQTGEAAASVQTLLAQANFWSAQQRPEVAWQSVSRALAIAGNNPEVLGTALELAYQLGRPEAPTLLARLRAVAPNDPRLQLALNQASLDEAGNAAIAEARAEARRGDNAAAVQRYRGVFRGDTPPAFLAAEYYQALAATGEPGYQEAVRGLAAMIQRSPNNAGLQLTYAQLLTYREDSRAQGIELLQRAAGVEATSYAARAAWRQALLWLGDEPETAELIETYLKDNPSDPQLAAKLQQSSANRMSPATIARLGGWSAVEAKKLADAEQAFNQALAADPRDAESLIGLAIVRKIQARPADMRRYLDQAIALAPDRREEFIRAVDPDTVTNAAAAPRTTTPAGGAGYSPVTRAWQALNAGRLDVADGQARRALGLRGEERVQAEVVLGYVALRRDDAVTAEQRFRAALALRPQLPSALGGLYDALLRQERIAEADALEQEPGFAEPGGQAGRAWRLRERAFREPAAPRRETLLREAYALDPADPWVRLDLVRALRRSGRQAEAARLAEGLAQDRSPQAAQAAALLAEEAERHDEAVALLARVPVRLRTPEMNRLLARSRALQEVQAAARLAGPVPGPVPGRVGLGPASGQALPLPAGPAQAQGRAALLRLAGTPDASGQVAAAVIRVFGRLGDAPAAAQAARTALAANPAAGPELRLQLAGALAGAGQMNEAEGLLQPLGTGQALTAEQRRQLAAFRGGLALAASDRLLQAGDAPGARALLAPAVQEQPDNEALAVAMARLQYATGDRAGARARLERLAQAEGGSREARLGAAELALGDNDLATADRLLAEARQRGSADARQLALEAQLARAAGQPVRAQRLLENALRRRQAELQANPAAAPAAAAAAPMAAPPGGEPARDPMTAELVRDLGRLNDRNATWVQAGGGLRWHSGTRGLGRLNEISAPVEMTTPAPGLPGRLVVQTGSVSLNNGGFGAGSNAARQFGTNPLAGGLSRQGGGWLTGPTFGVGYVSSALRFDVGSTPMGMERTNVIGGMEVVAGLAPGLTLRLIGARRPVNETLLSYVGQRDSRTGRSWGGATRNYGRVDLSYGITDRFGVYASGTAGVVEGSHIGNNEMVSLGGGAYYNLVAAPEEQLTIGADARRLHYDRNQNFFSYGHGGYFSPQQYYAGQLLADWRRQWGALTTGLQMGVGVQTYRDNPAAVFPEDPALQAQLQNQRNANLGTRYAGLSQSSIIGGVTANLEYAVDRNFRLGATARYWNTAAYSEAAGLLYLRWRPDRPEQDIAPLLRDTPTTYPRANWPITSSLQDGNPEPVKLPAGLARPTW